MDFDIFRDFQIDTFVASVYVECCNISAGAHCGWSQEFRDGTGFEELVIAAASHYGKVHEGS